MRNFGKTKINILKLPYKEIYYDKRNKTCVCRDGSNNSPKLTHITHSHSFPKNNITIHSNIVSYALREVKESKQKTPQKECFDITNGAQES